MEDIEKVQEESDSKEKSEENKDNEKNEKKISDASNSFTGIDIKKEESTIEQEDPTVARLNNKIKEVTYKLEDFIENAKALGYKKEVVIGALFNCKKIEMTKSEFEDTIKNFLGKKVE